MAKANFKIDPNALDIETFNNHKHTVDTTIKFRAHDEPSEPKQTSTPIGGN